MTHSKNIIWSSTARGKTANCNKGIFNEANTAFHAIDRLMNICTGPKELAGSMHWRQKYIETSCANTSLCLFRVDSYYICCWLLRAYPGGIEILTDSLPTFLHQSDKRIKDSGKGLRGHKLITSLENSLNSFIISILVRKTGFQESENERK